MAEQTDDPLFDAMAEHWEHIVEGYLQFEDGKPVMLYDIQEQRIYAFQYEGFKSEMSGKVPGFAGGAIRAGRRRRPNRRVRARQRGQKACLVFNGLQVTIQCGSHNKEGKHHACPQVRQTG